MKKFKKFKICTVKPKALQINSFTTLHISLPKKWLKIPLQRYHYMKTLDTDFRNTINSM